MHNTLFQAGQYCGDYRIEKLLGAGGYAEVYRALCVKTNESVALKVLHARHNERLCEGHPERAGEAEKELGAALDGAARRAGAR